MRVWKWRSTSVSTRSVSWQIDVQSTSSVNETTARSWRDLYVTMGWPPGMAMRGDARQAWFPPCGGASCTVFLLLLLNPRPPPPGPCPRPSVCRGQPMALRHGATGRRPRASRPRAWTTPAPGARGTEPEGCGGVGSPGCRLPSVDGRGRVRPCTTGSSPGVRGCWRLRQTADKWRTAVRDTGDGRGAPPRRTQAERALQDPKASRASAGAVRARPAGRAYRPGSPDRAGGRRQVNWEPCPARHEPEGGM